MPTLNLLLTRTFAQTLVRWQKQHGRHHLPWQHTGDAYKTWLSEIMLQQTQVSTVLAYYNRFLEAYPCVADLAAAPEEAVMQLWAGLGYYSRARNLHACAKQVVARFGGQFPADPQALETLPGIGRSTAGAIASLAYGVCVPILDGNVKRVFCRYHGVHGYPEQSAVKKILWEIAVAHVPALEPGIYNQALMDLGATCCLPRNPNCSVCPLRTDCVALKTGTVALLPTPKPKKLRPELHFVSLLIGNWHNQVLLELQDQKGIWQELWIPPCVSVHAQPDLKDLSKQVDLWLSMYDLQDHVLELHAQIQNLDKQPWLIHELTHRKMHFKVLVANKPEAKIGFYSPQEKPVPKIVHKLIEHSLRTR